MHTMGENVLVCPREYLKRAAVCTEVYSTELRCTFSVLY